jgi:hypothetical protein
MTSKNGIVDCPIVLGVRTGDTLTVEKWDGRVDLSVSTYAVALFVAPDLKELGLNISKVALGTGVVAAGVTLDGWGWIVMEPVIKDMVSDLLQEIGARPGEWFKLTIKYINPFLDK